MKWWTGASAIALAMFLLGAPNASAQVQCGDVLTQDTKLHRDLLDCPQDGLIIGADDITLNLNGHTIASDHQPEYSVEDTIGIRNTGGYDRVTIKNGQVGTKTHHRFFNHGVLLAHATANKVKHLRLDYNFTQLEAHRSFDLEVSANKTEFGISGFVLDHVAHAHIFENKVFGSSDGMAINNSFSSRVANNAISRIAFNDIIVFDSEGIRIAQNTLGKAEKTSVALDSTDRSVVRGNRSTGSGISVGYGSHGNVLTRNHLDGDGITIGWNDTAAVGTVVRRNVIVEAKSFDEFFSSKGRGIFVTSEASRTKVRRNQAKRNEDDGIMVRSPETFVRGNRARSNGGHGIAAVPGTEDGGYNLASGNRTPPQCLNIRCH